MITIGGTKLPFLRYIFSIFTYAKDMTDIWKSSLESFLSLTSYWTHLSRNTANTSLKANASNAVCGLSRYPTKVLSAFCSKYKDSQEKTVNVIVPNAFPDFLRWMPGSKDILLYDRYKDFADKLIAEADVICCLDFNALKRIDDMADAVAASPARKIMIDHHLYPEDFCKIVMSYPKISSTSELIFRLICRMGYFSDISKEGAECIYTGMMTDTGGFTYNSNNREIYFIISELLSKGIDKDDIYRKVYNTYSESRLRLMGYVLSNMTVYSESNSALITLTKAEQSKFNYIKGDREGFVNILLSIKNVCFSCFLREDTEKPMIKISLRSVGTFPCNQLAAEFFHGGGHLNASGGEFFGTMEEAKAVFEKALEKYKPLLTAKS